jgi:hypothetical protein
MGKGDSPTASSFMGVPRTLGTDTLAKRKPGGCLSLRNLQVSDSPNATLRRDPNAPKRKEGKVVSR